LAFAVLQLAAGAALAQVVTDFSAGISTGARPMRITAGPDGNVWFTEPYTYRIGRITPSGVITEFGDVFSVNMNPQGITLGHDGNLWFTGGGSRIGRITPSGVITEFITGPNDLSDPSNNSGITAGPDGNLWFTTYMGGSIGRITPAGVVTKFSAGISAGETPYSITSGSDGNLWFTEYAKIGRITPSGVVTEFCCAGGAFDITAGPDGNLWFTEYLMIGRITPAGVVTHFSAGITGYDLRGITTGPDGNLWFVEGSASRIGRITPAGVVTEFSTGMTADAGLAWITAGPDGNLWFTGAGDWTTTRSVVGRMTTPVPPSLLVVEYHHSGFDHYFITPVATEIALLDAHAPPFQEWSRTGFSFNAYANVTAPAGSVPICRFFNNHFAPKSSHFYAAHGFGCEATLAQFPDWGLEDDKLFNMMLPNAISGVCPIGTIPVYRLYNDGMGEAPNHRFVTDVTERQNMLNQGWVAEGAGFGVGMCAPK
jgi:streptogramin lyase